nr:MAG TPA: hypothetical protein [Caudoviricetes sp.]
MWDESRFLCKTIFLLLDISFVDCPQTVVLCDIVRTLKSISAIEMFKAYPQLNSSTLVVEYYGQEDILYLP